jgi:hypothetical protein
MGSDFMAEETATMLPRRPNLLREALKRKVENIAVDEFAAAMRKASIALREEQVKMQL